MNLRYDCPVLVVDVPQHEWHRHGPALRMLGGRALRPVGGIIHIMFPATLIQASELTCNLPVESDKSYEGWHASEVQRFEQARLARRVPTREDYETDRVAWWEPEGVSITEPYAHQWTGTGWLAMSDRCLLLDDMGLGKTKEAIDAACYLMNARQSQFRVLVICPNSVKENWKREIERHGWSPSGRPWAVQVLDGSTASSKNWLECAPSGWFILNYERLRYVKDAFFEACQGAILIVDEAHRCKNRKAKQTQIIEAARPERLWMLTGTPIANRLDDLWSLANIVRPGLLGWTYWHFAERHIVYRERRMRDGHTFRETMGFKDVETVRAKLSHIAVGRRKEDCLDLPAKVYERRTITLSPEERGAYREMQEQLRAWFETALPEANWGSTMPVAVARTFAIRMLRLRQISDGLISEGIDKAQGWSKDLTKLKAIVELWEDAGRRMVVWCAYVPAVKRLCQVLQEAGAEAFELHGETKDRQNLIDRWGASESGVLVAQMDTGGEGLNLQAADLEVFCDVPWTLRQRRQCEDRLHRIGQTRSVTVVDMLAEDTVDAMLLERLEARMKEADEAVVEAMSVREAKELLEGGRKWESMKSRA